MSRIGKLPIAIPKGVTVEVADDNTVVVKSKNGELSQKVGGNISVNVEEGEIILERSDETPSTRSAHGLYRALINNMVTGVHEMFTKKLEVIGVGYRASANGQMLELNVGYSHPIHMQLPPEVKLEVSQEKRKSAFITLKSVDKQLLGHVAAKIRSFRKPEPYKGKGIRYVDEYVRIKEGKKAGE